MSRRTTPVVRPCRAHRAKIYGFLLFAILAVFVAGLMVGRTPEYVGTKIESREVKLAVLAIAVLPLVILGFSAISAVLPAGLAGPLNKGPHGFSEILYAFASASGTTGPPLRGITADTPYHKALPGVAMWIGRFFVIVTERILIERKKRERSDAIAS